MKICLVSVNANQGAGLGRMVLNISEEFKNQNFEVGFIYSEGDFKGEKLLIDFYTRNLFTAIKNIFLIAKYFKKYDYILCFDIKPVGLYVVIASILANKKYFLHCVGTYSLPSENDGLIKRNIINIVYKLSAKTFMLSSVVLKEFARRTKLKSVQSKILHPGVNSDIFFTDSSDKKYSSFNSKYILSVGEVKSRKGHDIAVKAFHNISKKYADLKYVIVGRKVSNPFTKNLDKYISDNNLKDKILFLENVDDIGLRQLYSNAEFFLMPSITTENYVEGFGIVYLEAALTGITSIGCFGTGAEDAILDMETGKLCEQTVEGVSAAMNFLLENTQLRNDMAIKAQLRAQTFTWEAVVNDYKQEFLVSSK